ncbi:MAG: hypothetical protein KDB50_01825 [Mycobacterium sp.]|nr:hypothetical protein [Mycobacterium sp.]
MRNAARVLAFDVAAPLAAIAGLLVIGLMLGWPLWWVSVCSMLCLLVVQAMVVNVVLYRRDAVTMGTDDDAPGLRLAAVALAAAVLVVATVVGYNRWTLADRAFDRDAAEVARIAGVVAEASATFSASDPTSALDRAAAEMVPETAAAFRAQFGPTVADLAKRNVTAQARTISAGLEALSPTAASVAVLIRATQSVPGKEPSTAVLPLRVALSLQDDAWKVVDVTPITSSR